MLKHVVMWRLAAQAEGRTKSENAQWMKEHLEALVGQIPELLSAEVGINVCDSDMAFDAVLISTFESTEALAAYKVHPKHKAVSDYCKKIRLSRVVCDFWED